MESSTSGTSQTVPVRNARISRAAETPAPNRWPRGSIIRAFGRRAAASVGMALGIGLRLLWRRGRVVCRDDTK